MRYLNIIWGRNMSKFFVNENQINGNIINNRWMPIDIITKTYDFDKYFKRYDRT